MKDTCYAFPDAYSYETLPFCEFKVKAFIKRTPAIIKNGRTPVKTKLNCQHFI